MPSEVPHDFLLSVAEAFPFASEDGHRLACTRLVQSPGALLHPETQPLSAGLEAWLRPRARGLSLDTLAQVRDLAWFEGGAAEMPLADYAVHLALRHLESRGNAVGVRLGRQPGERLSRWRWLSLLLPADLLLAALAADKDAEPGTDHVSLVTPQLAQVLERPVAETHLHLGAATSFGLLWTALVRSLAHHPPGPKELERGGQPPFGDGKRFLGLLLAAAIGRILLAGFVWQHELVGQPRDFGAFLEGAALDKVAERMGWAWGPRAGAEALREAVHVLCSGDVGMPPARLGALYRVLLGLPAPRPMKTVDAVLRADPLAAWLEPCPGRAMPETRFAARALRYLRGAGRGDEAFARVFWQYQRVRCLTFRHVTQEPGTAGLDWFKRHFDRLRPLRARLDGARFEGALITEGRDLRLRSLEGRTAPEPSWVGIRDLARGAAKAVLGRSEEATTTPEVGIVLHFLKEPTGGRGRHERLHADPRQIAHGCRFGRWAYARQREAMAIEGALERRPELLLVLRGVDIASSELAVPTWVSVPVFQRVRDASIRAAERLARCRPTWQAAAMRTTCHAGEDYRRLIQGLRRVHELIEFGVIRAGDRIGHGLALGDDPARWARRHARASQLVEERLEDLLWELDRYARGELEVDSGRYAFARAEARRLARTIYADEVDLDLLAEARRRRHDPRALARFGFPFLRRSESADPVDRLVLRYLTDAGVFLRGQEPVEVHVSEAETRLLAAAQRALREELGRLEVTVEGNPSSNLLINDMGSITDHPALSLQPLPGRGDGCPVLLSLNTDDPVTFATCLADEMAYVYGALLRGGVSAHDALEWLDARRENGWRSRFTLPASTSAGNLREVSAG